MIKIRPATRSEQAEVTNTLADAFAHDPMLQWVAGVDADVSIEPRLRTFFGALVKLVLARDNHLVFTTRTPRMIGAFGAAEKAHPKAEHYFLEAIGTRRDQQSKGVGSAAILPMLDRCDAEGMPAYLESSNLQNVPFYARHGFEATGEIDVGKGAPPVTAMWRDPR